MGHLKHDQQYKIGRKNKKFERKTYVCYFDVIFKLLPVVALKVANIVSNKHLIVLKWYTKPTNQRKR